MGLRIAASGAVLAPRSETQLLAREAIRILRASDESAPVVVDMCCGSGNLALAIADALPSAHVIAADLTDGAVAAARANVERLGFSPRIHVTQGDLFDAVASHVPLAGVSMVVCNPPYISTARLEGASAHLLENEPREAFDGGPYGISILQRLVRDCRGVLKAGGHLAFEFGEGQERQALALLERTKSYDMIELVCDPQGRPRVAVARFSGRSG
ncbi:MAG: peptide chain release factor N(5)-glutamine methyltransferase [Rhizobiaceae bacterium]|nr:peptide chain release factor N(5)-glutamine methyltransferase [Rhizobiaceae bacterium]